MELTGYAYHAAGIAALLAALLPRLLSRAPISMPMVFLAIGVVGFTIFPDLPDPDPVAHPVVTERLTELVVIISLMGAGLAIDRPLSWRRWRRWRSTWRLLVVTMPVTIAVTAVAGWAALGLAPAAAMLLAAVLSPTDPVLASEVQVGEPTDEEESEDEPRFALTSEAGLNDGLAFPFTNAAVAMATAGALGGWFPHWFAVDLLYRIVAGVAAGLLVGWLLGRLFFSRSTSRLRLAEQSEGFVAIACTFLAYGAGEIVEGYGFVAVFVCALTIRAAERTHGYHQVLHTFIEQVERLLTVVLLLLLGGAIARGLLGGLGWREALFAAALLLVVRPLAGLVGLMGTGIERSERVVISFFGVRGIGSLYYLAYALEHAEFAEARELWAVTGLVVALSVVLHGVSATPVMRRLDVQRDLTRKETARVQEVAEDRRSAVRDSRPEPLQT